MDITITNFLDGLLSTRKLIETPEDKHIPLLKRTTPEERREMYLKFSAQNPNKVLAIVQRDDDCNTVPLIAREKFLFPPDMEFSRSMCAIRQRIPKLSPDKALFYFVGKKKILVTPHMLMSEIARQYANDDDHFVVIYYRDESTFG